MGRISYFLFVQLLAIYCHHALAKPSPPRDDSEKPKHQIHGSIVSIQLKDASHSPKGRHLCTGVIVSERHVITEFRCLKREYDFLRNEILYFDVEAMQIATTGEGGSEKLHDVESLRFFDESARYRMPALLNVVMITLKDSVDLTASPKAATSSQDPRGKNTSLFACIVGNDDTLAMEQVPLYTLRYDECEQFFAKLAQRDHVNLGEDTLCSVRLDRPSEILPLPIFNGAVIADDTGVVALGYFSQVCYQSKCLIFHDGIERYKELVRNVTRAAASS